VHLRITAHKCCYRRPQRGSGQESGPGGSRGARGGRL